MNILRSQNSYFSLALVVLSCAISLSQPAISYAQPSFKVDLGIAEVMQALHAWWQDIVARSDQMRDEETRKSAHTVAMAYLEMAGLMETFSNELEIAFRETPQSGAACPPVGGCRATAPMNMELISADMQETMDKTRNAIHRLDAQWVIANVDVSTDLLSNVPRRGLAVNETSMLVIEMRDQRHEVTKEEASVIEQKLRSLAEEARAIASEIATALNE